MRLPKDNRYIHIGLGRKIHICRDPFGYTSLCGFGFRKPHLAKGIISPEGVCKNCLRELKRILE